ncbi:ribP-PPkin: ribose-phosphate diphosphokinase [Gaiella occulta]|uniref:ribose-phosphate diphosphokinase n=1 Tax=Gaiella occulta TaxID=1002870 RepID=A0A7M2YWJ3_9ACTN|nr:ribose-phosphate pyrophosphokinase [Gaiella occulta]RDI74446.1 ribP-PPkin: ribose-phosphate diphosphokinase [Gaiella occulta]
MSIRQETRRRLMLFCGRSAPALSLQIAASLGVELGAVDREEFANGDRACRYEESVRGADVFIVQTAAPPLDAHLVELLVMVNAARLASAKRVTAVIPRFFYAGHDRKSRPREPITARLVAAMIERAGAARVLTMDLHAGQVPGFFSIPVDHMTALPLLAEHFRERCAAEDAVVVSPDTGRTKLAGRFAAMIDAPLVVLNRDSRSARARGTPAVIGSVAGKAAILVDDIIDSGATLVSGAAALRDAGAARVLACATHGVFSGDAAARLAGSAIETVVITDTVPLAGGRDAANVEVLTASGILADTIANVFSDTSVSAIFAGANELF